MPTNNTDATNKKYVDDKIHIVIQNFRTPQRTIRAGSKFNATVTLNDNVPLNKFTGIHPTSNTGLIFSYNLSVNNSNQVEAINIAAYNVTSFDITASISFVVQYYA